MALQYKVQGDAALQQGGRQEEFVEGREGAMQQIHQGREMQAGSMQFLTHQQQHLQV